MNDDGTPSHLHRLWDLGEQHLAAGRYVAARRALESAEAVAWRRRDARSLARIYLPLLEARRQIRYNAVEGTLVVVAPGLSSYEQQGILQRFLDSPAGTILLACSPAGAPRRRVQSACLFAGSVQYTARRTGRWLEALLLMMRGNETRLTSLADPTFAAGLPATFTTDANTPLLASTDPALTIPLPPPGHYPPTPANPLHAMLRESLLVAWEALALKWQHRHPPSHKALPWEELAWLRLALHVDPACEPIAMRLIALAEAIERQPGTR